MKNPVREVDKITHGGVMKTASVANVIAIGEKPELPIRHRTPSGKDRFIHRSGEDQ